MYDYYWLDHLLAYLFSIIPVLSTYYRPYLFLTTHYWFLRRRLQRERTVWWLRIVTTEWGESNIGDSTAVLVSFVYFSSSYFLLYHLLSQSISSTTIPASLYLVYIIHYHVLLLLHFHLYFRLFTFLLFPPPPSLLPSPTHTSFYLIYSRSVLQALQVYDEAKEAYREAMRVYLKHHGPDHPEIAKVTVRKCYSFFLLHVCVYVWVKEVEAG